MHGVRVGVRVVRVFAHNIMSMHIPVCVLPYIVVHAICQLYAMPMVEATYMTRPCYCSPHACSLNVGWYKAYRHYCSIVHRKCAIRWSIQGCMGVVYLGGTVHCRVQLV